MQNIQQFGAQKKALRCQSSFTQKTPLAQSTYWFIPASNLECALPFEQYNCQGYSYSAPLPLS